jgi:hypothetical protein
VSTAERFATPPAPSGPSTTQPGGVPGRGRWVLAVAYLAGSDDNAAMAAIGRRTLAAALDDHDDVD